MFYGGLNEIFSDGSDGVGISEFKNARLDAGVVLSISSVTIHIASDATDVAGMRQRENPLTGTISLASGNFTAGTDFPAGVYDVVAVSGSGNVSSDNIFDGGLNEIMGTSNERYQVSMVKNVQLFKDVVLSVSGVEIQLIPSN